MLLLFILYFYRAPLLGKVETKSFSEWKRADLINLFLVVCMAILAYVCFLSLADKNSPFVNLKKKDIQLKLRLLDVSYDDIGVGGEYSQIGLGREYYKRCYLGPYETSLSPLVIGNWYYCVIKKNSVKLAYPLEFWHLDSDLLYSLPEEDQKKLEEILGYKLYSNDFADVKKVVLFGHGFGGNKDNRAAARFAEHVLEENEDAAVITFDWPCHGNDEKERLRLEDCTAYLQEVVSYVNSRFVSAELYAYATGFGGYLFLKYISENKNPFMKTALRCPAVNMYDMLTKAIMTDENREAIRKGKPALVGFDRKIEINKEFVESLKQKDITKRNFRKQADTILILHGTEDEIVPIETVRLFAERNGISFISVEGADHRFQDTEKMDFAIEEIVRFFNMR